MEDLFISLINRSITASYLILVVIILRIFLKKAPKWIHVMMWGMVGVRLICPFSIESALSLIPSVETIPQDILLTENPVIHSGLPLVNNTVNPIISQSLAPVAGASANPMQILIFVASILWLIGVGAMLVYAIFSYLHIRKETGEAVILKENVWIGDRIVTPFILGIIKPRIYLPSAMLEGDIPYVLSHEKAHIKRLDYIWKPLAFLILSIYWFQPVVWVAYILFCRDIEFACDERVLKELGSEGKKDYSSALLNCSVPHKMLASAPLAFGEIGVKQRIKNVLQYKKPRFWIVILAALACILAGVFLLSNPMGTQIEDKLGVFLESEILGHHRSEETNNNFACVDYQVLGRQNNGNKTTVYLWVLYQEYSFNEELINETGSHVPAVITVEYAEGRYQLSEYWEPRDGAYYEDDIKARFPFSLRNKALDSQSYIEEQKANNLKKAQEYYNDISSTNGGVDGPSQVYGEPTGYIYTSKWDTAGIYLNSETGKCTFSTSLLSSYMGVGTYEKRDDLVIMKTDDGLYTYTFREEGENLVFVTASSSGVPSFKYTEDSKAQISVPDGAVFKPR